MEVGDALSRRIGQRLHELARWRTLQLVPQPERINALLRDVAYITIGFGVLTVQQVQVRRRELLSMVRDHAVVERVGISVTQLEELVSGLEVSLGQLESRFAALESRLDSTVEALEHRLPDQAGQLLGQAHDIAKVARQQVLGLIRNAA